MTMFIKNVHLVLLTFIASLLSIFTFSSLFINHNFSIMARKSIETEIDRSVIRIHRVKIYCSNSPSHL